jgi:hypothetical protein
VHGAASRASRHSLGTAGQPRAGAALLERAKSAHVAARWPPEGASRGTVPIRHLRPAARWLSADAVPFTGIATPLHCHPRLTAARPR